VTAGSGGLSSPYGLAFGPDGNLYVDSPANNNILEYNGRTGGYLTTFVSAGSGGLTDPAGLVFGPDGNLYVSDEGVQSVDRFEGPTGPNPGSPLPAAGQSFGAEWRIYARASGDDKVPIVALLAALDAIRENKIALKSNIKFIFEGEEEAGSPNFEKILADNKNLLQGDVFLICDGPLHQSRRQQLVFGVRGIQALDITVYGARRELHSGHYGNWAPNPAMMLAQLLASMKNEDGRVLIDHFYDGIEPLGEAEKRAIAEAPDYDDTLKQELWLGHTDGGGKKLLELLNLPSLNVRGISSGHTGAQASNVIPATATASIDMRLVKGIDHSEAATRVIEHVRKQGYFVVDKDPDRQTLLSHPKVAKVVLDPGSYNAQRTPMDLPIARRLTETIEQVRGPVIKLPTSGASLPLYQQELGTPTISIPIANHDDNQHTFNENLRMQNLWDGIEVMAAVLTM